MEKGITRIPIEDSIVPEELEESLSVDSELDVCSEGESSDSGVDFSSLK